MRFLHLKTSQRSGTSGAFAYFSHRKVGAPLGATRKLELKQQFEIKFKL
jgi:hypothetical protein